jgi:hypothetical protein
LPIFGRCFLLFSKVLFVTVIITKAFFITYF